MCEITLLFLCVYIYNKHNSQWMAFMHRWIFIILSSHGFLSGGVLIQVTPDLLAFIIDRWKI